MEPNSHIGGERDVRCIVSDIVNKVANRVVESNVRVENEDHLNIITANDLFRKDSDSFFREKSSYDDSLKIDSLFFKDSDSDFDEELAPDLAEEVSDEPGHVLSEEVSSDDIVEEVSSDAIVLTNFDVGNVSSISTSGSEDIPPVPADFWYSGDTFSNIGIKAPNSSKTIYWIPQVPELYLPRKDMIFDQIKKAILVYFRYGDRAGFNCRRSSVKYVEPGSKEVLHKYVICSRGGKAEGCNANGLQAETGKLKRKYPSQMRECPTKIGIKMIGKSGRCFTWANFLSMCANG